MKILFLTQIVPYPLDAGPKMRIYYVLRYLSQFHEVTLVSFTRNDKETRNTDNLRSFLHGVYLVPIQRSRVRDAVFVVQSLITRQPFLIVRDHVAAMHAMIKQLLAENSFDFVHADQLGMAQYAVNLSIPKVLDQHNAVWTIVHRLWQNARTGPYKLLMGLEWRKLQKYEARICRQFDRVLAVTEEDKQALESLDRNSALDITALPICIDPAELPQVTRKPDSKNIICVGGMFYPPNVDGVVWFARQVFGQVKQACPESQFVIVGARPAPQVVQLGHDDSRVCVTGYVDDTTSYLCDSAVFIIPLRAGGGMRVKILDAWARGVPIVSTTIGCEGIEVRPEENILIADTPESFAEAVLRVLRDPGLGKRLADNGRRWVEEKYNWRVVYQKLDAIYPKVAKA